MKRTVAVVTAPGTIDFIRQEVAPLGPHQVLLKTLSVGLCHTDLPTYLGTLREAPSPKHGFLRTQCGLPDYPAEVGHEPVCVVAEVGAAVTRYQEGDHVAGMMFGAFADWLVMAEDDPMWVKIPAGTPNVKHCLAEPMGCIVNVIRETAANYGENVAVVGCGFMGLLTIAGLARSGVKNLVALDLLDSKLELARQMGATATVNPGREQADDRAFELTGGRFFDAVVEISGSLKGLDTALSILREAHADGITAFDGSYRGAPRVILGGVYGNGEVFPVSLAKNLVHRCPLLISAYPLSAPRPHENMQEAVDSFVDGRLPMERLVSHEIPFRDLAQGFRLMQYPTEDYIKGIVVFE